MWALQPRCPAVPPSFIGQQLHAAAASWMVQGLTYIEETSCTAVLQESPNRLWKEWTRAVNDAAATLTLDEQEAAVHEHCRVFAFNNAIVKGYPVGWLDWPRAYARLVPGKVQLGLAIGAAACAYAVARLWTAWAS